MTQSLKFFGLLKSELLIYKSLKVSETFYFGIRKYIYYYNTRRN
ncbi:hypothetical protein CW304_26025 [Bacillus sp. UFRGS-B20]|nr:hypothetical protein CW304_26025 [Bacillus sp. UFRGS-B20]